MKLVCESLEEFKKGKGKGMFGTKINGVDIEAKVWKLLDLAERGNYPIKEFSVEDLKKNGGWEMEGTSGWTALNDKGEMVPFNELSKKRQQEVEKETKEDILKTDLSYPIIVSINKKGQPTAVLDGNHRLSKAILKGLKSMKGYALPEEDILKKFKK